MKRNLLYAASVAVFGLLFSTFVFAQNDKVVSAAGETYVISAKAGGVNYVEGKVAVIRVNGTSGLLAKNDRVEIGDRVEAGADGKAEILLNPGSYVRLGANAVFAFQSTDLEDLKLKLSKGSAIFEVYADNDFKVSLDLPDADIELTRSGVYRVDVLADGSGKISVWKGKLTIDGAEIKSGRTALVKGKSPLNIAKFDRDNKDSLDVWSDLRAREASQINKRLQRDALTSSLLGSFNRGGWNMYGTFGLWVFDSFSGRWCFLPFGQGWSSPYGYGYGFNIYNCPLPPVVYMPPVNTTPTTPTTPGTPMTPAQAQIREERRRNMQTPTFQRFENNQREERGGGSRNNSSDDNSGGGNSGGWNNNGGGRTETNTSQPTYTPTPSAPTQTAPIVTPSTRMETKSVKDN